MEKNLTGIGLYKKKICSMTVWGTLELFKTLNKHKSSPDNSLSGVELIFPLFFGRLSHLAHHDEAEELWKLFGLLQHFRRKRQKNGLPLFRVDQVHQDGLVLPKFFEGSGEEVDRGFAGFREVIAQATFGEWTNFVESNHASEISQLDSLKKKLVYNGLSNGELITLLDAIWTQNALKIFFFVTQHLS